MANMSDDLYRGKYSIDSHRLKGWNYGDNASYFVTICCKDRVCYFGEIVNGQMQLSDIGQRAQQEWIRTFELRRDMNMTMGEFVVMPNHFHAIITIGINEYNNVSDYCGTMRRDTMRRVPTMHRDPTDYKNQFGPQSKNLASIIRCFKSAVTTYARKSVIDFAWQPNYHDHIIRNDQSFYRISEYIVQNPIKWREDSFHVLVRK